MKAKNDDFLNIQWIGKKHFGRPANQEKDVTITLRKDGYAMTFRNGINELIGDYIVMAVRGDKVLFRGASESEGLKFSGNSSTKNKYLHMRGTDFEELNDFLGDYDLQYNEDFNYYYIKKEKN